MKESAHMMQLTEYEKRMLPPAVVEIADSLSQPPAVDNPEPAPPQPAVDLTQPLTTHPETAVSQPAATEPAPANEPAPLESGEDWHRRFDGLTKVLARKNTQIDELSRQVQALEDQLNRPPELSQHPAAAAAPTDDTDAELPEGMLSLIDRRATEKAQAAIKPMQEELERAARDRYYEGLFGLCPDAEAILEHPQFNTWREQIDPLSGRTYRELLAQAHGAMNHRSAAAILNTFMAAAVPAAAKPSTPPPPPSTPLDSQVMPAPGAGGVIPPGKKTYTQSEIDRISIEASRGKYTQAEAERLLADIQLAAIEGRITPG